MISNICYKAFQVDEFQGTALWASKNTMNLEAYFPGNHAGDSTMKNPNALLPKHLLFLRPHHQNNKEKQCKLKTKRKHA